MCTRYVISFVRFTDSPIVIKWSILSPSSNDLVFSSPKPSSASRKVVSKLCINNKNKKVVFSIRETTRGSNKKIYGPYIGYMKK